MKLSMIGIIVINCITTAGMVNASDMPATSERYLQLADAAYYWAQFATGIAGRYGPWATWNRANQAANDFRREGYSAQVFHSGDGYYIDVR